MAKDEDHKERREILEGGSKRSSLCNRFLLKSGSKDGYKYEEEFHLRQKVKKPPPKKGGGEKGSSNPKLKKAALITKPRKVRGVLHKGFAEGERGSRAVATGGLGHRVAAGVGNWRAWRGEIGRGFLKDYQFSSRSKSRPSIEIYLVQGGAALKRLKKGRSELCRI